jgi:hypothetical protein
MAKPKMPRVLEPDTGIVHYKSDDFADAVTLCGMTDWLGQTPGKDTTEALTCHGCKSIKQYCDKHSA